MAPFTRRSLVLLAALLLLLFSSVTHAVATKGAENDEAIPEIQHRGLKGCKGSAGSIRCKSKKGAGKGACMASKGSKSKFTNKPRIRREWRTLDAAKRAKVAAYVPFDDVSCCRSRIAHH
jgi:hypothetical protein